LAEKEAKLAAYEKAAVIREATDIVTAVFAEVKVNPPPKLVAKLTATVPMKEGKVDADTFRAEVKEIAETMKPIADTGEVRGMGSGGGVGSTDATSAADHAALVESFERRFRNQGKKPDEAKKLAETAAKGR
jgi:hypothetical protein